MRKTGQTIKRIFDIITASGGLIILSPILTLLTLLIWLQDFQSPFYISSRVGKNEKIFKIIKLRSMIVDADKSGVDSTAANDHRITRIGHFIRSYKFDELSQLWNVVKGNMSLVGPRPNVKRETDLYTNQEKRLLSVKPGITDFASIVFADEGDLLFGSPDPDILYNQLIRPGKSKLGLFYISSQTFFLDIVILIITVISIFSRKLALQLTSNIIRKLGGSEELVILASRKSKLTPTPPPGSLEIVDNRTYKEIAHKYEDDNK
jgi:lipopolysaccharide/colanic/teichoic acid biosynthesis glycosyltransferase